MLFFYIGIGFIVLGLGTAIWFIASEKKTENQDTGTEEPLPPPKEKSTVSGLLKRLDLEEKAQKDSTQKPGLFSRFKPKFSFFKKKEEIAEPLSFGTSALRLDPVPLEEPIPPVEKAENIPAAPAVPESDLLMQHDDLKNQYKELQERCEKLDALLSEKTAALEKAENTLSHELKNSKEFNKVKDVLEKELKDAKDKSKTLQNEMTAVQSEAQTHLKRVNQLEEKIKDLEKEILEKESTAKGTQAETQKEQQHIAELTEKIKKHDEIVKEKDRKIVELVNHLILGSPPPQSVEKTQESDSQEQNSVTLPPDILPAEEETENLTEDKKQNPEENNQDHPPQSPPVPPLAGPGEGQAPPLAEQADENNNPPSTSEEDKGVDPS